MPLTMIDIELCTLDTELISLRARLNEAQQYEYNESLIMECKLLKAQIKALEERRSLFSI